MKLGVITDCFKKRTLDAALKEAAALKLSGVQIYATSGAFAPEKMNAQRIARVKEKLAFYHLDVSALCGDMGGYGFQIAKDNPERIQKTKRIIDLAQALDCHVVTSHIGVIPVDKQETRYRVLLEAMKEVGAYAQAHGVTLAIETGPERASTLLAFLQDTEGGIGVNLDPANFVMVTNQNPVSAVFILKDWIVHTHAKDGVRLAPSNPKEVYDAFARGGIDALTACTGFKETPLGKGQVPFPEYLKALRSIGYTGYLTIERETGDTPSKDIAMAVRYLRKTAKPLAIL